MKLNKSDAHILAELIMVDVRTYVKAHPEEYAAFVREQETVSTKKRRRSRKADVTASKEALHIQS